LGRQQAEMPVMARLQPELRRRLEEMLCEEMPRGFMPPSLG
jgi:hypothetical protein